MGSISGYIADPRKPPIDGSPKLGRRFDNALPALGRLDAVTDFPAEPLAAALELCAQRGKEAVPSSMIEGTQSWAAASQVSALPE
jgi:hypothetical protein